MWTRTMSPARSARLARLIVRGYSSSAARLAVIPFNLTDIGEGIQEVEIIEWFIEEGAAIKQFDRVCEVQSDKANVEITSRYDGKVTELGYPVGGMAQVGAPLFMIDVPEDQVPQQRAAKADSPAKEAAPAPVAASAPAPVRSATAAPAAVAAAPPQSLPAASTRSADPDAKILTTPTVRRLAKEHGIDLSLVEPTGPQGRVLKGDMLAYIAMAAAESAAPAAAAPSAAAASSSAAASSDAALPLARPLGEPTPDTVTPIRGMQRLMVKSMVASLDIPHFGYCDEYDVSAVAQMRAAMNSNIQMQRGIKLSFLPFFLKAASLALTEYPVLNSSLQNENTELRIHGEHNIGVAMDTPRGLVVPCVKGVAQRSIVDIAAELQRLQIAGAEGKLGEADLTGTTFSLSNIGSIGGTYAAPVINPPQVAIGAIGKLQELPRFDEEGNIDAVKIMNFSWAADHRVVDGAMMARFSNQMKAYIEQPYSMLGNLR